MKTYTQQQIKQIMIDRPAVEFHMHPSIAGYHERYQFTESGTLFAYDKDGWLISTRGLPTGVTYTIPADNEKPVELPGSVRKTIESLNWGKDSEIERLVTALWADTVKLVEANKL